MRRPEVMTAYLGQTVGEAAAASHASPTPPKPAQPPNLEPAHA
jgi:hypothetical protein